MLSIKSLDSYRGHQILEEFPMRKTLDEFPMRKILDEFPMKFFASWQNKNHSLKTAFNFVSDQAHLQRKSSLIQSSAFVTFRLIDNHKNHFIVIRSSFTQAKHLLYNIMYKLKVSWSDKTLCPKAVCFLYNLVLRKTLLFCGDVEKNLRPFNILQFSTFDKVLDPSQKCLNFFLIKARSIQNKYEDLSKLLQQLDSQTILVMTETWSSHQQDTNFNISNEHLFLRKAPSKQTGVQRGRGVGVWIPRHFNVKFKKKFEIANANSFESMWLKISEPLKGKCLVIFSYSQSKNLSNFFLERVEC